MIGQGTKLQGKVTLITGAGDGIGRAIALLFAQEGARVIAASRTLAHAEATARDCGPDAFALQVDVADEASVAAMTKQALDRTGRIDVLVNNAGIGTNRSLVDTEPEEWDRVFAVNVRGVYLCTRAVLPGMLQRGTGSIINMASSLGLVGAPRRAAYCASKGAVIALTKQVAIEHAQQGIRCNCICPGTVESPWVTRLMEAADDPVATRQELEQRHPIGRLCSMDEVARTALFLASDDAPFITGSAVVIDGGQSAR